MAEDPETIRAELSVAELVSRPMKVEALQAALVRAAGTVRERRTRGAAT